MCVNGANATCTACEAGCRLLLKLFNVCCVTPSRPTRLSETNTWFAVVFAAVGAGLVLAGRFYREMQRRIQSELKAAEEALERRARASAVPLERDPATGVYRPRRAAQEAGTRH